MDIKEEKLFLNYSLPVTMEQTEIILEQMKKNICKIHVETGIKGTGFFCKIPYPDDQHLLPVLITNNHIIDESNLIKGSQIYLTIKNDEFTRNIKIDDRKVYTNKNYDTSIIEIKEKQDNIHDFLVLDSNILDNSEQIYIGNSIYILHYPNNQKASVSYGIFKKIVKNENYYFSHLCSTEEGSSGSPILNLLTNKIIGIHLGSHDKCNYNIGTLLKYPIKEFITKNQPVVETKLQVMTEEVFKNKQATLVSCSKDSIITTLEIFRPYFWQSFISKDKIKNPLTNLLNVVERFSSDAEKNFIGANNRDISYTFGFYNEFSLYGEVTFPRFLRYSDNLIYHNKYSLEVKLFTDIMNHFYPYVKKEKNYDFYPKFVYNVSPQQPKKLTSLTLADYNFLKDLFPKLKVPFIEGGEYYGFDEYSIIHLLQLLNRLMRYKYNDI